MHNISIISSEMFMAKVLLINDQVKRGIKVRHFELAFSK
jgi:hypothetical protein